MLRTKVHYRFVANLRIIALTLTNIAFLLIHIALFLPGLPEMRRRLAK